MRSLPRRRPSPSMLVALLALFVALGGTSYAALTITGKNVRNGSLTGKDVKNNSLTGADVTKLRGGDVTDGSLTGADVKESSLGKVPSAAGADRAGTASRAGSAATANSATSATTAGSVGGVTFKPIAYTASPGSPAQTVLDAGGLRLTGKCLLGADIELTATTTVDNAAIYGGGFDTDSPGQTGANDLETGDFDTAGSFDVLQAFDFAAPDGNPEMGTLVYTRPGAPSVTVLLAIDESGTQCFVHGHALIG